MRTTVKVRAKVNTAHVKKRYQAGRNKSLDRIGSFTMQSVKKQFLNKQPKKKPAFREVGKQDGIPVVAIDFRPPTPGRVTSWKTGRGRAAKGFLRGSIRYERDDRKGSVVIGPAENAVWLNRIQEFGGARQVSYQYVSRRPVRRLEGGVSVPGGPSIVVVRKDAQTGRKGRSGVFKTDAGRVKPGLYMAGGLAKVRPKIPDAFRNFVSGP